MAVSATNIIDWQRHDGDRWFHAISAVVFGGSTHTRCDGRWPESDPVERSKHPPEHERCRGCVKRLEELGSPAVDFGFDHSDVEELGGEG